MLTIEHSLSKAEWDKLAHQFCRKERKIQDLVDSLFSLSPKQVTQQHAGYVLLHIHRMCPSLLSPKLPRLLSLLDKGMSVHTSIPRQLFSVLQDRTIPEMIAGEVFAKALDHFLDLKQPIGARARALETCANVASQYDGLWPEVYALTQSIQPQESPGIRSIGARVAKQARRKIE